MGKTTQLTPCPRSGAPFVRAVSRLFAGTVATVAAPELDCAALPDGKDRPRVYAIYVCCHLASGTRKWYALWGTKDPPGRLKEYAVNEFEDGDNFRIQTDPLTLRVGLIERREVDENGTVTKTDPVVGLHIESNGPPPAVRWAFRPGVRDLFRGQ